MSSISVVVLRGHQTRFPDVDDTPSLTYLSTSVPNSLLTEFVNLPLLFVTSI